MLLRAVVIAALLTVAFPVASRADCWTVSKELRPGVVVVIEVCDGDDGPDVPPPRDGGDPPGGPGVPVGGGPAVTCVKTIPLIDFGGVVGTPPEPRADGSIWAEWYFDCSDGTTEIREVCASGCPVGGLADPPAAVIAFRSVPDLRLEALGKVSPPLPGVRHSFDQVAESGDVRAVVLAEQWWWMEASLAPVTARASDGPVWVEVTATPGEMVIDPGDGTGELACDAPGVAYNLNVSYYDQVPGQPRGACVHVYEQTSAGVTATMSQRWEITWEGATPSSGPLSGTLEPIVRSEALTFPVREIQSVISSSD